MASDITVSIAVLAAAKGRSGQAREQALKREEEWQLRELALRRDHIAERRGKALNNVLGRNGFA